MHKQCDTIQIRKPSLLLYLLLMVILLPALLASADSDSYSVDSFTESVSGGDISGSNYQGDYAFIYQQGIEPTVNNRFLRGKNKIIFLHPQNLHTHHPQF